MRVNVTFKLEDDDRLAIRKEAGQRGLASHVEVQQWIRGVVDVALEETLQYVEQTEQAEGVAA